MASATAARRPSTTTMRMKIRMPASGAFPALFKTLRRFRISPGRPRPAMRGNPPARRGSGVVPIPPRQRDQTVGDGGRLAVAQRCRRASGDDRVGRDILRHHGAGGDDRAMAHRDLGPDDRAMADPGVVADHRPAAFAMGEEFRVMFRVRPVIGGAIHEMVQAGAVERVVGGTDPGKRRDVGELADARCWPGRRSAWCRNNRPAWS
jgi:hypothetical protein